MSVHNHQKRFVIGSGKLCVLFQDALTILHSLTTPSAGFYALTQPSHYEQSSQYPCPILVIIKLLGCLNSPLSQNPDESRWVVQEKPFARCSEYVLQCGSQSSRDSTRFVKNTLHSSFEHLSEQLAKRSSSIGYKSYVQRSPNYDWDLAMNWFLHALFQIPTEQTSVRTGYSASSKCSPSGQTVQYSGYSSWKM